MRDRSYRNAGVIADGLIDMTGAATPHAKVACLRVAEALNMLHFALKGKR